MDSSADKTEQADIRPVVVVKGGAPQPTDATPKDKRPEPERKLDLSTVLTNPSSDYDGDAEFIGLASPKYVPFDPFEATKVGPGDKTFDNWEVQASLFEVSKDGKSYRISKLSNKASFQARVRESAAEWDEREKTNTLIEVAPPHELREASARSRDVSIDEAAQRILREDEFGTDFQFGGNTTGRGGSDSESWSRAGYGSGIDANAEYIPLLGGPTSKALYQYQYLEMHAKAFEAYNHNPVAHQLVELQTSFVLGRGVDHTCTNEDVEEVWQEFVERTNFYTDLENIANDLWWQGEMMMEFYDNTPKKGYVDYRMIDPSTVWDIITDVEDIQKIYYYHQQYSCLTGETKVALTDGTNPTIQELAERHTNTGETFSVYSYDLAQKKIVPGTASVAKLSGIKRCVEVELDNGEIVTCSWDHPFLNRRGEYVLAQDLAPGDSLMPLYRRQGYEEVWQPESGWIQTHRTFAETLGLDLAKGRHIDHIDGVKTHNSPSNLQSLTRADHARKTYAQVGRTPRQEYGYEKAKRGGHKFHKSVEWKEATSARMKLRWATEGEREAQAERARQQWAARTPERRAEIGIKIAVGRGDGYYSSLAAQSVAVVNHKVVAVREAREFPVYDLTVDLYHNFALTAGVFVHNTVYQQYTRGNIETMKYIIRQIPAEDVLHIKLNVSKYEKRGRTDLFSILGWLKRLKDLMNSRVIKGQLEAAFVWDVTVNSGDADVSQATLNLPDPYKAGSTFVHNKNLTLSAVGGTIKGGGGESGNPDIHALINMIAVGFGIPAQFIGEVSKGAKAGALSATEPGTKRFERRQRLIENICHSVANRVIALAIKAGRLDIDGALPDARSITKLGAQSDQYVNRDDVKGELEQKQDEANQKAEQVNDQNNQMAVQAHKVGMKMQVQDQTHRHSMDQQMLKQQHQHNMATAKNTNVQRHEFLTGAVPTPGAGTPMEQAGAQQGAPAAQGQPQQTREASLKPQPKADTKDENTTNTPKTPGLNKAQKRRKQTIKDGGNFAKEFLEFIFPAIAQEDRSAKLKDLALAEAMQWLPKSWAAKLAAKELNITTYSWEDAWREIQEEAKLGLSIAHVYTQDNQHVPDTTIAQDVQAELAAKQPVPAAQQQVNVPVPPPVAGDKLMPAQPPGGAPGQPKGTGAQSNPSAAPGKQPNSGSTKTNKFAGQDPVHTDPTAKSHGYSAAANSPLTSEGIGNIKRQAMKQSLKDEIKQGFLREVLGPAMRSVRDLAQFIMAQKGIAEELIESLKDQ